MNRERGLRRQLADLMMADPPPLTGRQLLEFKSIISGIEADLQQYERALQNLCIGSRRTPKSQIANRKSQITPLPVRVLLTGVPLVHGAERVLELIESCGAVVVCMENCTGLKPILEDVDLDSEPDPIRAIAQKYYHLPCSVMTPNPRRFETLRALAAKFRPHCVIELVWQACLTYDVESCAGAQARRGGIAPALPEDHHRLLPLGLRPHHRPRRGAARDCAGKGNRRCQAPQASLPLAAVFMICAGIDAGSRATKVVLFDSEQSRIVGSGLADQGVEQQRLAAELVRTHLRRRATGPGGRQRHRRHRLRPQRRAVRRHDHHRDHLPRPGRPPPGARRPAPSSKSAARTASSSPSKTAAACGISP